MPLFEAYKLIGQWQFGNEWKDGQELAAPSDEEIAENRKAEAELQERVERKRKAAHAVGYGSSLHRIPKATPTQPAARSQGRAFPTEITRDDNLRKAARKRADQVWDKLRQWLFADKVPQMVLDADGGQHTPPSRIWAAADAITILHTGRATVDEVVGHVLLSQTHLETAIHGEEELEQAQGSEESEPALSDKEPHPEKTAPSGQYQAHSNEAEQPEPEFEEGRRDKRKRETKEKYQRWYNHAQEIKDEGRWTRSTDIASAIAKRETMRLKGKGVNDKGINATNIKRRLDEHYPGWSE